MGTKEESSVWNLLSWGWSSRAEEGEREKFLRKITAVPVLSLRHNAVRDQVHILLRDFLPARQVLLRLRLYRLKQRQIPGISLFWRRSSWKQIFFLALVFIVRLNLDHHQHWAECEVWIASWAGSLSELKAAFAGKLRRVLWINCQKMIHPQVTPLLAAWLFYHAMSLATIKWNDNELNLKGMRGLNLPPSNLTVA